MMGRVCEVYDNDDNDNGGDDDDNDNNQWPVARCMVTVNFKILKPVRFYRS